MGNSSYKSDENLNELPNISLEYSDFDICGLCVELYPSCVHHFTCDKLGIKGHYTGITIYKILNKYGIYDPHFIHYQSKANKYMIPSPEQLKTDKLVSDKEEEYRGKYWEERYEFLKKIRQFSE
jgi:hypothetical protein